MLGGKSAAKSEKRRIYSESKPPDPCADQIEIGDIGVDLRMDSEVLCRPYPMIYHLFPLTICLAFRPLQP